MFRKILEEKKPKTLVVLQKIYSEKTTRITAIKKTVKITVPEIAQSYEHLEHNIFKVSKCYVVGKNIGKNVNGSDIFLNYFFFKIKPDDLGQEIVGDCEVFEVETNKRKYAHIQITKIHEKPKELWEMEISDKFHKKENDIFPLPQLGRVKIKFSKIEPDITKTKQTKKKEEIMKEEILTVINKEVKPKQEENMSEEKKETAELTFMTKKILAVKGGVFLNKIDDLKKITVTYKDEVCESVFVENAVIILPENFDHKKCYKAKFFEATTHDLKTISGVELLHYRCEKNADVMDKKIIKIVPESFENEYSEFYPIVGTNKAMVLKTVTIKKKPVTA